jgi:secernin
MRVSCDSLVALGSRTRSGRTIFAKNSDRPAAECQPLVFEPARRAAEGARLRCQYVTIDDVAETIPFTGARPSWLWGVEHGVNARGVAIGNHTIFTRDAPGETGLLGMDLVRLGLERGATASAAVEVIIELVERHGQGGSGYADTHWPYNNSFLVADAREAFLLETSASRWALKRAHDGALSASNHASIGEDWDRVGHDTIEHAVALDWWPEPTGVRFDFARAYRTTEIVPPVVSSGRYATTCRALSNGALDIAAVERVMRDHYASGDVHVPGATPDEEAYFSVCMHADPVGTTTASMVVELHGDPAPPPVAAKPLVAAKSLVAAKPLVAWMALTNPCIAPYLPVFVGVPLPAELTQGTADPSSGGAWHRFKALLGEVEKDFVRRAPFVRDFWRDHELALRSETDAMLERLPAEDAASTDAQTRFLDRVWQRISEALDDVTGRVRAI